MYSSPEVSAGVVGAQVKRRYPVGEVNGSCLLEISRYINTIRPRNQVALGRSSDIFRTTFHHRRTKPTCIFYTAESIFDLFRVGGRRCFK